MAATAEFAAVGFRVDERVRTLPAGVRERMPLILVTNATDTLHAHRALLGLTGSAHAVISSGEAGVAEPDPRIYELAAAAAGVAPGRCLFVDDRLVDVEGARALGMTGVHYRGSEDLAVPAALG
ncbi:HAD-IA family hydrolase [Nocardia thailandica]|uniref:HAD-IA family hydrolase n=1 Tax=Nocardia thailandica TaxID=257275 RepID=A0ABW6PQA6_9NOCA